MISVHHAFNLICFHSSSKRLQEGKDGVQAGQFNKPPLGHTETTLTPKGQL